MTTTLVAIPFPPVRCAAPLCGDKIKNGRSVQCWFDGERYYHTFCRDEQGGEKREEER